MKYWLVLPLMLTVSSCDRFSQRIWNCSSKPLQVTAILETGKRVNDVIPAKNYTATMKGGVQILALERDGRIIWQKNSSTSAFAGPPDDACHGRIDGLVAEQF